MFESLFSPSVWATERVAFAFDSLVGLGRQGLEFSTEGRYGESLLSSWNPKDLGVRGHQEKTNLKQD